MPLSEELSLPGITLLGTLGSVCAILLRTTHQNLKTLDLMRRDAVNATEELRQELRDHDNTLFELQAVCANYRLTIAQLEVDNAHLRELLAAGSPPKPKSKTKSKKRTSDPDSRP